MQVLGPAVRRAASRRGRGARAVVAIEHVFVYDAAPMDSCLGDLRAFCALHLGREEAERLVGWIAWRTGRNQALAGSGEPADRLEHALVNWLDDGQRARLLAWLRARIDRGESPVPG